MGDKCNGKKKRKGRFPIASAMLSFAESVIRLRYYIPLAKQKDFIGKKNK